MSEIKILVPFDAAEAISIEEAAEIAGCSGETIRRWVALHHLGRRIGGRWKVSHAALQMYLDGNWDALQALREGDRMSSSVRPYLEVVDNRKKASTNSTNSTNATSATGV